MSRNLSQQGMQMVNATKALKMQLDYFKTINDLELERMKYLGNDNYLAHYLKERLDGVFADDSLLNLMVVAPNVALSQYLYQKLGIDKIVTEPEKAEQNAEKTPESEIKAEI